MLLPFMDIVFINRHAWYDWHLSQFSVTKKHRAEFFHSARCFSHLMFSYLSVIFLKKRTKAHFAMFQAKWPSPVCPLLSPNATKRRFKASTFVVYVLFIIFFIIAELLDMARWDLGDWCPSNVINRIYLKILNFLNKPS